MQKLLIIIVSLVVLAVVARFAIGFFSADKVATGLGPDDANNPKLASCDGLQNCASSTSTAQGNYVEPFEYTGGANDVIARMSSVISSQAGTQIITQQENYLHATYKTKLLGYTDDLELLLDESTGILNVRSASRIGKSDLGANRKRIEELRSLINNS